MLGFPPWACPGSGRPRDSGWFLGARGQARSLPSVALTAVAQVARLRLKAVLAGGAPPISGAASRLGWGGEGGQLSLPRDGASPPLLACPGGRILCSRAGCPLAGVLGPRALGLLHVVLTCPPGARETGLVWGFPCEVTRETTVPSATREDARYVCDG